jgi:hypothetical protein
MPDTTFIITPSGDEYSMVSDIFFDSLQANQYDQTVSPDIALDWLLNVKKFCVVEENNGTCFRGIYEATYEIEDYSSHNSPVTDLRSSYKELQIGGSDSSNSTGKAGEVMQTSPRNPHRYTLQEDSNNVGDPPAELTGEYLGAFFHHKGSWYSSFDDIENIGSGSINSKEITENTKKIERGSDENRGAKAIYVLNKFFPKGVNANIEDCSCAQNIMIITFTSDGEGVGFGLESRLIDEKDREACGGCESGSEYMNCIPDDGTDNNFIYEAGRAYLENDWTSSFNIDLYANIDAGDNCPDFEQDGEGFCLPKIPYTVDVTVDYRGVTKSESYTTYKIATGSNCAGLYVGILTVYSSPLPDGSYFELM